MELTRIGWRKSTYSSTNGGNCVEVGMELTRIKWRKSRCSSGNGGDCVEVGAAHRTVAVRDSKDPAGPALEFAPGRWQVFTRAVKNNRATR